MSTNKPSIGAVVLKMALKLEKKSKVLFFYTEDCSVENINLNIGDFRFLSPLVMPRWIKLLEMILLEAYCRDFLQLTKWNYIMVGLHKN